MLRFLIPFAILIAIDLYFFQAVRHLAQPLEARWRVAVLWGYWVASGLAFTVGTVAFLHQGLPPYVRFYLSSIIMVLTVPKLIGAILLMSEDVFRLGAAGFRAVSGTDGPLLPSRRDFISKAGLVAAALPFGTMLYGMARTAFNFTIRKRTISSPHVPQGFDGLRIVQLSDMHTGSFSSADAVRRAFDLALEQQPDIIFFTGDLVNNTADEAAPFVEQLSRLKAPLGVYSVLGNHDYGDYVPWPSAKAKQDNLEALKATHRQAGWRLLMNEHVTLERNGDRMAVLGIENWGAAMRFPKYGRLNEAVRGTEGIPFKILLSHDPSHWDAEVRTSYPDIDLTLSGHTHGFQFGIEVPGFKWSPVQYVYKQWAGLYREGRQFLYVNRGLGFLGFMGRIGIPPEITVLELKREESHA